MKYFTIVLCISLAACGPNTSQTTEKKQAQADSADNDLTPIEVKPIHGYFVKNTVKQTDSITCWVINSPAQRDSILGVAKTMTNRIDTLNFATETITAVVLQPSEMTQELQLASSMQSGDEVHLHFAVRIDTPKRTFTAGSLWMGALPKTPAIKNIRFYSGDRLLRTIPVTE